MKRANWHRFQVLTKRDERLEQLASRLEWPPNVWMGVTVENRLSKRRVAALRKVPASVRFLSVEPLLESLGRLNMAGIHWVIVGGESGPGARPMEKAWVDEVKEQCITTKIPFFFKQWGGVNKKKAGRVLDGRLWDSLPVTSLAVKEI